MALFEKDLFTRWLEKNGIQPVIYQPAAYLGAPPLGWRITLGQATFVYRIPEETPETLIIVLFERQGMRKGLRSPFCDFARFISLVKKSGIPVHTIQGHVEALRGRPEDSLENPKIAAFYRRYLAADRLKIENGIEWVMGDLRTYVPPLASLRSEEETLPGRSGQGGVDKEWQAEVHRD